MTGLEGLRLVTALRGRSRDSATVTREITVEVLLPDDGPARVPVVMHYDIADPYAVCAEFHPAPGFTVRWVFARDLLLQGLDAPSGDGDVHIRPSGERGDAVRIDLTSPGGEARVLAATSDLVEFVRQTYAVCPPGTEGDHVDVDAALTVLQA